MEAKKSIILFLLVVGLSACGNNDNLASSLEYDNNIPAPVEVLAPEYNITEAGFNGHETGCESNDAAQSVSGNQSTPLWLADDGVLEDWGIIDWNTLDYVELIDRQTGEAVKVREGESFEGFYITHLEHSEFFCESMDDWRLNRLIVVYEKEIALEGTLIRSEYFGRGGTYLRVSEEELLERLPQDIGSVFLKHRGLFLIMNDEVIISELGDEFEVESIVTVSRVHLRFIAYSSANNLVEIVSFESLP